MISRDEVSFKYYTQGRETIIDLDTVPLPMRSDYALRNRLIEEGRRLCRKCDGTGNEIFAHYRRCSRCDGTGIEPKEKNDGTLLLQDL